MKTPKAPKPPDPYRMASAQSGANRDAVLSGALMNNYDENSPFGTLRYKRTGVNTYVDFQGRKITVPKFERTISLSPEQQGIYDQKQRAGKNMADLAVSQSAKLNHLLNKPFDPQNLPEQAVLEQKDYSKDRKRVEDAMLSRYNRMYQQSSNAMESKLLNQGLTPGSSAWNEQMDQLGRQQTDARTQAILAGGNEQSRLNALTTQRANYQNQLRQQALAEAFAVRNQPLNEITALMSGSQIRAPQFAGAHRQNMGASNIAGYTQNAYQGNLRAYQQKMAQQQAMMSGLFRLGAAGLSAGLGGFFAPTPPVHRKP